MFILVCLRYLFIIYNLLRCIVIHIFTTLESFNMYKLNFFISLKMKLE